VKSIPVIDLGFILYQEALEKQRDRVRLRARGDLEDALLLCQHPEVVTVGRGLKESAAAVSGARLAGIPVIDIFRGGQATLHLPGQIVGYPILKLEGKKRDLHGFLRMLEQILIEALSELANIKAERRAGLTGVWVEKRKIASIGIGVERWVSFHGFALNVSNDLSRFHLISPCGLSAELMTSVENESSASRAAEFHRAFADFIGPALALSFAQMGASSPTA
jgi:lipoate-protein ligase B